MRVVGVAAVALEVVVAVQAELWLMGLVSPGALGVPPTIQRAAVAAVPLDLSQPEAMAALVTLQLPVREVVLRIMERQVSAMQPALVVLVVRLGLTPGVLVARVWPLVLLLIPVPSARNGQQQQVRVEAAVPHVALRLAVLAVTMAVAALDAVHRTVL